MRLGLRLVVSLIALWCVVGASSSQVVKLNSPRARPELSLGNLSLTASPSTINMSLTPHGLSAPSPTLTITNQVGLTALGTFSLWGYFSSTNALASTAGDVIPSSAVLMKCPSGTPTSYTPFTQSSPWSGGSSVLIFQTNSLVTLALLATQTCTLEIDLSSFPQLPAGTYSGTLIIQAQAL